MIGKKLTKITLGGKERTFYYGLGFLGLFIENTESTLESLEEDIKGNPFKVLPQLMFYSLKYGFVREDKEPDFNRYDVSEWIDEAGGVDSPAVISFIEGLYSSMETKLPKDAKKVGKQNLAKA